MNPIVQITIHSTMISLAVAQYDRQPESENQPVSNPIHPSIPVVLGILSVMFAVTFLLCAYAKFCHGHASHSNSFRNQDQGLGGLIRSRSRFSGIDKLAIESLPFFRFSSLKGSKDGLECAVCISRFQDSEVLRLLPNCRHAFHMPCIDRWLARHSTCPLCRYKLDAREIKSFTYSNSLRYVGNDLNDLEIEIFVEREQETDGPDQESRKLEEITVANQESDDVASRALHKVRHTIVVSEAAAIKSRWSDVNSSDMLRLSSEMLSDASSKRFERFSVEEQTARVKEDMKRKRVMESKMSEITTRAVSGGERRSMSEITNVSRFMSSRKRVREEVDGEEERTRRLWLMIARTTVRWFAGRQSDATASSNV